MRNLVVLNCGSGVFEFEVHGAGCRDLERGVKARWDRWTLCVDDGADVVVSVLADVNVDFGRDVWSADEVRVMGCCEVAG